MVVAAGLLNFIAVIGIVATRDVSLGDVRAYSVVIFNSILLAELFGIVIASAAAAILRKLTGRGNAVTRFFEGGG